MMDATNTLSCLVIAKRVEVIIGRLMQEDSHLTHILTHAVELSEQPKNAKDRRGHAISRVLYTWLRIEHENPEAVAKDIETLAALGRTDRWQAAIRTWAHIARTDPDMFHQYATYTNYAAE
jgi:hypothetical protein